MFKAKIKAPKLKDCVESVSTFIDEVRMDILQTGISIKAVDPANVAMVSLFVPIDSFDSFEATECELGIDIQKLGEILEMADKDTLVELSVNERDKKFNVKMGKLVYNIRLLNPENLRKTPNVSNYEYKTSITMLTEDFSRGVRASEKLNDYAYVGVKDSKFYIEAEGDTDSVILELGADKLINISAVETRSIYSLDYLSDMIKSARKSDKMNIDFSTDFPFKMSFRLDDGKVEVSYILSPRVEAE